MVNKKFNIAIDQNKNKKEQSPIYHHLKNVIINQAKSDIVTKYPGIKSAFFQNTEF